MNEMDPKFYKKVFDKYYRRIKSIENRGKSKYYNKQTLNLVSKALIRTVSK